MGKPANKVLSALGTTIFETMSGLAVAHGAVNLGQGFPEGLEPPELIEAAVRALGSVSNQYPSLWGLPALREAVATHERRFWGLATDPAQVMITSGATEALAACLFALIEPGDEVVVLEPLYDSYLPIIRRAGGIPRLVRLAPPAWDLPRPALAAAFSAKTKLMILNSPMNPCGKVFGADDLAFIASLLERHDAYALCDEVYEHLTFDGCRHIPLSSLPGMAARCLKVGSAGKIFSLTGWKVGWVVAQPELLAPVAKAHQFLTFTTPPNLQAAVAFGLGLPDAYYQGLTAMLSARRDRLHAGLAAIGFDCLVPQGSYFLSADVRPLGFDGDDGAFCRHITERARVAAIPVSAFYEDEAPRHFARFCFAKTEAQIDTALERLTAFFRP